MNRSGLAAGRRTPGARSTCPAPAGSSSTPHNGLVGSKDLIRVAVARNPAQAAPLTGAYFGAPGDELGMEVTVEVTQPKQVETADLAGV